jgi:hypothetical protein
MLLLAGLPRVDAPQQACSVAGYLDDFWLESEQDRTMTAAGRARVNRPSGRRPFVSACLLFLGIAWLQPTAANELRAAFESAQAQSQSNVFGRPVYLQSTQDKDKLQGDVHALINRPYAELRRALTDPGSWCSILILHLNVKYCRASTVGRRELLDAGVGRKFDQALEEVYWLRFEHRVDNADDNRFQVSLLAPKGPLGTKDYSIVVQATPYSQRQSVLRLNYSYGFGTSARLAMQAYLATLGSDKVGFSIVGQTKQGQPIRVGGLRGVLERNTIRYYLAIEAHLEAASLPPPQQLQASLQRWFDATERYPQQLHEMDRADYLLMKQRELRRQETGPAPKIKD